MARSEERGARWARGLTVVAWLGLPLVTGPAMGDALDRVSDPVWWVTVVGLYTAWGVGLLALLVPRPVGLTALRIGGPGALAVVVWAVLAGGPADTTDVAGLAWAAVVAAAVMAGTTADVMVDGASYGAERRFTLRAPAAILFGPAQAAWLAVVAGATAGPLLLAATRWIAGAVLTLLGVAAAVVGARALHQLSRRWVVFVPAGLVLHDPLTTIDPVLFPRRMVSGLGPAPADTGDETTIDVTGGAPGLVLEVALRQPIELQRRMARAPGPTVDVRRVRFTPVRGAAVLAEAGRRRLSVEGPG